MLIDYTQNPYLGSNSVPLQSKWSELIYPMQKGKKQNYQNNRYKHNLFLLVKRLFTPEILR